MNLALLAPALVLLGGVSLTLVPGTRLPYLWRQGVALLLLAAAALVLVLAGPALSAAGLGPRALWAPDGLTGLLRLVVLAATACGLLLARREEDSPARQGPLLIAAAAALVAAGTTDLLSLPVAILTAQLPLWSLAAAGSERGREGALKAMVNGLLGVVLAGAGAALFLVEVGSVEVGPVAAHLGAAGAELSPLVLLALALWLAGLGMLLGIFPLHMWLVDFLEVLPVPGLVLVGAGISVAGLGGLSRLLLLALEKLAGSGAGGSGWAVIVQVGGLAAVALAGAAVLGQRRLRRLFANLLVGQIGFMLVVLAAAGTLVSRTAALAERMMVDLAFYLVIHAGTWIGLVLAVELLEREHGDSSIDELPGLATERPRLALVVGLALLSLAGMPPTAGFWSRWLLLEGLVTAGWTTSAILLALSLGLQLVVSLGLVTAMFRPATAGSGAAVASPGLRVVAWVVVLVMSLPGLLPLALWNWCAASVGGMLGG